MKRNRKPQKSDDLQIKSKDSAERKMPFNLRPPRSAAIVLTLQPGAQERGISYASVLREAKATDLSGFGLTAVRVRKTVTGARILEISGDARGKKADEMAKRLGNTLEKEDV